jgi:Taurine catabolism dioxygenase TauD, TfdA family
MSAAETRGVPPIGWTRASLMKDDSWVIRCPPDVVDAVRVGSAAGHEARRWLVETVEKQLDQNFGFIILTGLPVDGPNDSVTSLALKVSQLFGSVLPQDNARHLTFLVQDEEARVETGQARGSQSSEALHFHTDSAAKLAGSDPDTVGLLVVRPAASGGQLLLSSAIRLLNILRADYPDAYQRMLEPLWFDATVAPGPSGVSFVHTPAVFLEGRIHVLRYSRQWITYGYQKQHLPIDASTLQALDAVDEVLARPGSVFRVDPQPGQFIIIHNRVILHNRTAFVDDAASGKRRLLVRTWIRRRGR